MNTHVPFLESDFLEHEGGLALWICYPREDFIYQDWKRWVDWVRREARKQGFTKIRFIRADAAITKLKANGRWSEFIKEDPAKIKALLSVASQQRRRG